MASRTYTNYDALALKGSVALLTDTIKVMLLTSSYTPNTDTDTYYSDISANESTGTGYTAGGQTLTSPTVTNDTTNHRGIFGAANPSWSSSTIANARYAVVYKSTGTGSTSPLIALIDFGATQSTNGDTFLISWNASGVFALSS
jgi:hypothetical protein